MCPEYDDLRLTYRMMRLESDLCGKPKMREVVDHLNQIANSGVGYGVIRSADSQCSDRYLCC